MTRNHMIYNTNNVRRYLETLNDIIMRFNQYYASFKGHSCKFWLLKYYWLLSVGLSCLMVGLVCENAVKIGRESGFSLGFL